MSHGLDVQGSAMFSARKKMPWHAHPSCVVVDKVETIEDGMEKAGLVWLAEKEATYLKDGRESGAFALVRSDNQTILTDGRSVGPQYTPLQNRFAFSWFQPFLDSKEITLETAGCLFGGQKVWVSALINRGPLEITKDDIVEKYLMLSNSHDGTTAVRVGFTPVRVVCANTLAMAHGNEASKLIRIKHSRKVENNLENIRDTINAIDAEFTATGEQYKVLGDKGINANDLEKYVRLVFDMKPDKETGKYSTRTENIFAGILNRHYMQLGVTYTEFQKQLLEKVTENFEAGAGSDIKSSRGTYWNAYNAVTEYLSHDRGNTVDTRLDSLLFGDSSRKNEKALELALTMAS